MTLIENITNYLQPFTRQRNTGNCYEIFVALTMFRQMGLTNFDLDLLNPLFEHVKDTNNKDEKKLSEIFKEIQKTNVGTGLFCKGKKVISIRNTSQIDTDNGTADIVLICDDASEFGVSVWNAKLSNNQIHKCLQNPSCKRFKCNVEDEAYIHTVAKDAVQKYKEEMARKYGNQETNWPSRIQTETAKEAASLVARKVEQRWDTLNNEEKVSVFEDLLCIKNGLVPTDVFCCVNDSCSNIHCFYASKKDTLNIINPCIMAHGIYLLMFLNDEEIGRTQVKFNNGVYHKGKTSSLASSWNAVVYLDKIFELIPFNLASL